MNEEFRKAKEYYEAHTELIIEASQDVIVY
jgi:hypothetical protein